MDVYQAIYKRRTIRKFKQQKIDRKVLEKLIDAARFAPSGNNLQPVKYRIVEEPEEVAKVFEQVKWAGYIAPEGNPKKGEEPVAFIMVLADTNIRKAGYELDVGAAVQNLLLSAVEEGIGTCWIGSVNRDNVRNILNIPENLVISTAIALGYPAEEPVSEEEQGSIKYYKDSNGVLHVPKRALRDIIINS
ncbi:MAG TPA: nitroreductase [Clostridiaceae bacterium]|jgi:nitroreductase|nr:nitroreductase [Clostridiaceae bacterium]